MTLKNALSSKVWSEVRSSGPEKNFQLAHDRPPPGQTPSVQTETAALIQHANSEVKKNRNEKISFFEQMHTKSQNSTFFVDYFDLIR